MEAILGSRDLAALNDALPVFIDYAARSASRAQMRDSRMLEGAINIERLKASEVPAARIPHAIEVWIGHLAWLDHVSSAVPWGPGDLDSDEAEGLALFRRAREKFWAEHSSCPSCQSMNLRAAKFCGGCGKDF